MRGTRPELHLLRPLGGLCWLGGSRSEPHTAGTGVCSGRLSLPDSLLIYVIICLLSGLVVSGVIDWVADLVLAAASGAPQWLLGPRHAPLPPSLGSGLFFVLLSSFVLGFLHICTFWCFRLICVSHAPSWNRPFLREPWLLSLELVLETET